MLIEAIEKYKFARLKLDKAGSRPSNKKETDAVEYCYSRLYDEYLAAEEELLALPSNSVSEFVKKASALADGGVTPDALRSLMDEASLQLQKTRTQRESPFVQWNL